MTQQPARARTVVAKAAHPPVSEYTPENARWMDEVHAFFTPSGYLVGYVVETWENRFVAVPYRGLDDLPEEGSPVKYASAQSDVHARQLVMVDQDPEVGEMKLRSWETRREAEFAFVDYFTSDYHV